MALRNGPDYGLDAPGVVRNLALVAAAGILIAMLIRLGVIPPTVSWHLRSGAEVRVGLLGLGLGPGIGCGFAALAMVYDSKVGKLRWRESLLDSMPWTGAEQVLDVGCGRGLLLIGAAKRLRTGTAFGIDLWQAEDLAGNSAEATLANAESEGVRDRVRVETADMRRLPFPSETFDRRGYSRRDSQRERPIGTRARHSGDRAGAPPRRAGRHRRHQASQGVQRDLRAERLRPRAPSRFEAHIRVLVRRELRQSAAGDVVDRAKGLTPQRIVMQSFAQSETAESRIRSAVGCMRWLRLR